MNTLTRLALLGASHLESPQKTNAALVHAAQVYAHFLQPWLEIDDLSEEAQREAAIDEYKRKIGDPNDPEFQAKLDKEHKRLRAELDGDAALRQAEAVKAHAEKLARVAAARKRQRVVVQ